MRPASLNDPARHVVLRRLTAVGGGLLGVAALAGCAPAASAGDRTPASAAPAETTSTAPAPSSAASTPAAEQADGPKDGTYDATGDYGTPSGPAAVAVEVALKDGRIASVQVEPKAQNPTARQYEQQFADGIGKVVVGKPIAGLKVGAVSGSSLTGQGFEKALAEIRSKADA